MSATAFEIRPAVEADLAEILALERSIPTAPHWPADVYQMMLTALPAATEGCSNQPQRTLLVAAEQHAESGILGFAAGATLGSGYAELESVAVAGWARRRGVGEFLCRSIIRWARMLRTTELHLEVRASSSAALALYRKLGFEVAGTRPHYYAEPADDAVLLRLTLTDAP